MQWPLSGVKMAICRWSSDEFKCDFYIYQDASFGGITVWIAGNHSIFDRDVLPEYPELPEVDAADNSNEVKEWAEKYTEYNNALLDVLDNSPREDIDHELAGAHFRFETPEEVVKFLEEDIIPSGKFYVPEWLIPNLRTWELIEDGPEN